MHDEISVYLRGLALLTNALYNNLRKQKQPFHSQENGSCDNNCSGVKQPCFSRLYINTPSLMHFCPRSMRRRVLCEVSVTVYTMGLWWTAFIQPASAWSHLYHMAVRVTLLLFPFTTVEMAFHRQLFLPLYGCLTLHSAWEETPGGLCPSKWAVMLPLSL